MSIPIPITPGITLDMSQNGTRTVTKPKSADEIHETEAAIERLQDERHKKMCEVAEIDSMISGAQGRLLQLRGREALQEHERLVEQRQKLTAAQHNVFEGGRW